MHIVINYCVRSKARRAALNMIRDKRDHWFQRSYRLERIDFYDVVKKIRPIVEAKDRDMAIRSSGGIIDAEVLLAASLRFLAGASYIDLVDRYALPETCSHLYVWNCLEALDKVLPPIELPKDEAGWRLLAAGWSEKMRSTFGEDYLCGTVLAKDGIVIETTQPNIKEVLGDVASNYNRKGYFGMVGLAAVDVNAKFCMARLDWSGNCNDNVAYASSELNTLIRAGELPEDLHTVSDEAFCASGAQELTPFSRRQLRALMTTNSADYSMKRTFNYLLSYQRCTVERAFGMLLRKWVILMRRLECSRLHCKLIWRVCVKLHNLCVDRWLKKKDKKPIPFSVPRTGELSDAEAMAILRNDPIMYPKQPHGSDKQGQGPRRLKIARAIAAAKFTYVANNND